MSKIALLALAGLLTLLLKTTLKIVSARLKVLTGRTRSTWDDVSVEIIERLKTAVVFIWSFYLMVQSAPQSETFRKAMLVVVVCATIVQMAIWGIHLIRHWRDRVVSRRGAVDPSATAALGLLYTVIQGAFLVLLLLIGLSNLGVDITALIAGLGVGGIALALAVQNVLGDFLASLSIVLDKPFVVGDAIVTGNVSGTVEHIGLKTTRIRSVSGEQLIVSNKDLLESRLQNFRRLTNRRAVQKFALVYATPADKVEQIPGWVREIVVRHDKLTFDHCHLMNLGEFSLNFELVFFVQDADFLIFLDLQQTVLLELMRKLAAEEVEFAFPTRTVQIGHGAMSLAHPLKN